MKYKERESITISKMPKYDQQLLAYLKGIDYDKYIEFLSKYIFPKTFSP